MVLTPASLFYYLHDRGLASAESVVDGDFRFADLSRRNQAFQVTFSGQPGYVVKQVGDWRPQNIRTFEAEAHWYWLARSDPAFAPLERFLSTCKGYDAENQILILEVPEHCEDLDRYHRRLRRCPVETAQLLGETLAAFHTALPETALDGLRSGFREAQPWVFSYYRQSAESLDDAGKGGIELLEIVKGDPVFEQGLEACRAQWRPQNFINGDMKFAHCILNGPQFYFIDWEMADFGDPLWDAAAVMQEYLVTWLRSMPASAGVPLADLVRRARQPLAGIQPAMRAFWQAYRSGTSIEREAALECAAGYAAARMIQTASESLKEVERITTRAVRMAQLARNILGSPAEAVRGLFGC